MTKLHIALVLSLGLNGLLGLAWVASTKPGSLTAPPPTAARPAPFQFQRVHPASTPLEPAFTPQDAPFQWTNVSSSDLEVFARNLLALGCPKRVVRDVIEAEIQARFAARIRALVDPWQARFWEVIKNYGSLSTFPPELSTALWELQHESPEARAAQRVETVLGPREQSEADSPRPSVGEAVFDFLPPERREALRALAMKTPDFGIWLWEGGKSTAMLSPAALAQRAERARRIRAALASLLSPGEIEELKLRAFAFQCSPEYSPHGAISPEQQRALIVSQRDYRRAVDALTVTGAVRRAAVLEAKARLEADRRRILGELAVPLPADSR